MNDERRQDLTRQTARAWRRDVASEIELDQQGETPLPGQLFLLPSIVEEDVEWLVVEAGGDEGGGDEAGGGEAAESLFVVAADIVPLAGSVDVDVPPSDPAGPLTVRCDMGARIHVRHFSERLRTGFVNADTLARVQEKRRRVAGGRIEGSAMEREVDRDPEYAEWREILDSARASLTATGTSARPRRTPPRLARARRLPRPALALAASVFGAVMTLGLLTVFREQPDGLAPGETGDALINLPIVGLASQPNRAAATPITLPAGASGFFLVLALPDGEPEGARYRLEILHAKSGEVLVRRSQLQAQGIRELTLILRRGDVPAGELELPLYRQEDQDLLVGHFRLQLLIE